ncbi:glycosyltransferase family 2 protein [Candidatus Peregrinibacteria bacterium]|nr:MAG: glycosyltransferase family 2 protein [Candidatus Peregrinibacteria bacterium]
MTHLLIALPALNEEKRISSVLKCLPKKILGIEEVQILVIDDGSHDNTANIAREFGVEVVQHKTNQGVGTAFQTAVKEALERKADILMTFDADGQFSVNEIPTLLQPILQKEADFVTGNRFPKGATRPKNMSRVKHWGNKRMSKLISRLCGEDIQDAACGFRAYSRETLLNLNLMGSFTYTQETILDLCHKKFRLAQVPIAVQYFSDRSSRVAESILRYTQQSLLIIFRAYRDYHPLRFFGYFALLQMGIGFFLGTILFLHYIIAGSFTPYKFLGFAGLAFFLFGVILFVVAIFADMLDRIRKNQERIIALLKKQEYGE